MRLFKDNLGREWKIELNIRSAKLLNERMKLELDPPIDFMNYHVLLTKLSDPFFAADFLYLVCKDQATSQEINEENFGASLGGIRLFEAQQKLIEEYIDFFPDPTIQKSLRDIVGKAKEMNQMIMKLIEEATNETSNETKRKIEAEIGEKLSKWRDESD